MAQALQDAEEGGKRENLGKSKLNLFQSERAATSGQSRGAEVALGIPVLAAGWVPEWSLTPAHSTSASGLSSAQDGRGCARTFIPL